jgi:phage terminase small subunit
MKTIDEVIQQPIYKILTTNEQTFVRVYVETGGDLEKATAAAFNVKPESARQYGRRVLARPQVSELLAFATDQDIEFGPEELKQLLIKVIKESRSDASRVSAARLIAEMEGWVKTKGGKGAESEDLAEILKDIDE